MDRVYAFVAAGKTMSTGARFPLNSAATPLNKRHIVIHGMSVGTVGAGTPGEVNGQAGYKTVLPVLCGEIMNGANSSAMEFRKS